MKPLLSALRYLWSIPAVRQLAGVAIQSACTVVIKELKKRRDKRKELEQKNAKKVA